MTTRGIRNNNPGNIRKGKDKWQGLSAVQPDAAFCTFDTPVAGIRAICRILLNYKRTGVSSVSEAITRWAPPSDQPHGNVETDAYIKAVADACNVSRNERVDLDTAKVMFPMVKAIIAQENAGYAYPDATVRQAMLAAGVSDAPRPSLATKVSGNAVVLASTGLALASQLAEPAKQAADALQATSDAPIIAHIRVILLTLAGIGALAVIAQTWVNHRRGA